VTLENSPSKVAASEMPLVNFISANAAAGASRDLMHAFVAGTAAAAGCGAVAVTAPAGTSCIPGRSRRRSEHGGERADSGKDQDERDQPTDRMAHGWSDKPDRVTLIDLYSPVTLTHDPKFRQNQTLAGLG
jgi:hypothetical protein